MPYRPPPSSTAFYRPLRTPTALPPAPGAVVEVDLARELHECPAVEPVPLVPVAPVVLGPEVVRLGVAEGERIPLVVVVRLVERERIVELELEPWIVHALQPDRDAVVPGLRG